MRMRILWPAFALLALPVAAQGQALVACEPLEATSRPGIMPTRAYAVEIEGGTLRRMVLTLANGQRSTTEFMPMSGGVSVRLITFPDPRDATRVTAVFNRAVVSPDGTVLVETWLRQAGDAAPAHNFYRLRCPLGGATK
ncbi:hypothetical protein GXW74_04675 [Roseomonas eburnea]|uniref:Uncharacterized protein n=1 Tax=Neoroseomonas eburnea TaxID=1346889 RepID=A0A9X9X7T3_9PROT|nr:hypothetical protein [Neoroseomonas eburnea]MBR0679769.1 hypothetical protein [Neoroseomonas eburnea]